MATYKSGGKCTTKKKVHKFAMGGVAKIRHEEATAAGLPLPRSKVARHRNYNTK